MSNEDRVRQARENVYTITRAIDSVHAASDPTAVKEFVEVLKANVALLKPEELVSGQTGE